MCAFSLNLLCCTQDFLNEHVSMSNWSYLMHIMRNQQEPLEPVSVELIWDVWISKRLMYMGKKGLYKVGHGLLESSLDTGQLDSSGHWSSTLVHFAVLSHDNASFSTFNSPPPQIASSSTFVSRGKRDEMAAATEVSSIPTLLLVKGFLS